MFEINFQLLNANLHSGDYDEFTFRYSAFVGNITMRDSDNELEYSWEWIPLLDFGLSMDSIATEMMYNEDGEETFEFTESEEQIKFSRTGDVLIIKSAITNKALTTTFDDFREAIKTYNETVFNRVLKDYPSISKIDFVSGWINELNIVTL